MENTPHLFISFSSQDLKYVREIMAALKQQDISFWDYSDKIQSIELGEEISDRLFREIDKATFFIPVISKNYIDPEIGNWCKKEFDYAIRTDFSKKGRFLPVMILENEKLILPPEYAIYRNMLYFEFDSSPVAVVNLTIEICKLIPKDYLPPVVAHPHLPFWKQFRKEVHDFAYKNKEHTDLIEMLGLFNEFYHNSDHDRALSVIKLFIDTCKFRIKNYQPFYPLLVKAVCETEMEQYDKALDSYLTAEKIHPLDQDVIGGKGTVFFKMNQLNMALECFKKILDINEIRNKDNARINYIITKLALRKRPENDEKKFLFNIDLSKYSPDLQTHIHNAQGEVLRIEGDYSALEKHCCEAIEKSLHDSVTVILLLTALSSLGVNNVEHNSLFSIFYQSKVQRNITGLIEILEKAIIYLNESAVIRKMMELIDDNNIFLFEGTGVLYFRLAKSYKAAGDDYRGRNYFHEWKRMKSLLATNQPATSKYILWDQLEY